MSEQNTQRIPTEELVSKLKGLIGLTVEDTHRAGDRLRELEQQKAELLHEMRRIADAKPDRLDHSLDVTIIERMAKVAQKAIANAEEPTHE
jgi:hypothetical protein